MKIKEFFKTLFSIRVYIKLPKINWRALRKRTKVIFTDRHAGDGTGWDIPEEDIEALADIILPGIIKFYSTKEGREEFLAWKKEREMKLAQEQEQHFLERKQENERLLQNNKKAANMTRDEFEAWYKEAKQGLELARLGKIDSEAYKEWLKK